MSQIRKVPLTDNNGIWYTRTSSIVASGFGWSIVFLLLSLVSPVPGVDWSDIAEPAFYGLLFAFLSPIKAFTNTQEDE